MSGIWSGFDSDNNKINSGNYVFKYIRENIQIINMENKHIPNIELISNKELGANYLGEELIQKCISDDNYICLVAIEENTNNVLGFCISMAVSIKEMHDLIQFKENNIPKKLSLNLFEHVGILKTIAVNNVHKGCGIGTKLTRKSLEILSTKNIQAIYSPVWKSSKGINSKNLLEQEGFEKLFEIKDYWKDESIKDCFICPVCGEPPCQCSMLLYYKPL